MQGDVSADFIDELWLEDGPEPVTLVTIQGGGLAETIYLTDHPGKLAGTTDEGIVSRGQTYRFAPFSFGFPGASSDEPTRETAFVLHAYDGGVESALDEISGQPTVTVELVRLADPDSVEMAMTDGLVSQVGIQDAEGTAKIKPREFSSEPACRARYVAARVASLF